MRFWFSDWVGVGPFCWLFLKVLSVVSSKEFVLKECYVARDNNLSWAVF